LPDFHESEWVGHRGSWATFSKIKEKYWWQGMCKDIARYWKLATNANNTLEFGIEIRFI
jgi:hypothetical protein